MKEDLYLQSVCRIRPEGVWLNGRLLIEKGEEELLTDTYHRLAFSYPKFFKMDRLCRLGFLASEILMRNLPLPEEGMRPEWAVLLLNRSASLDDDIAYQATIQSPENYYPSPSVFVYTLANIVTGEISIRHRIQGETACLVQKSWDADSLDEMIRTLFATDDSLQYVLAGWADYLAGVPDACLFVLSRQDSVCGSTKGLLREKLSSERMQQYYGEKP